MATQMKNGSDVAGKVKVVLGAQWGDEGKGKLVDLLAEHADVVARCQVRIFKRSERSEMNFFMSGFFGILHFVHFVQFCAYCLILSSFAF